MQVKQDTYQKVFELYTIKRQGFKQADMKVKRAGVKRLVASISVPKGALSPRKAYNSKKNTKHKAVRLQILKRNSMRELIKTQGTYGNGKYKAFVATIQNPGGNSHTGIFQRTDKPMREKKGKKKKWEVPAIKEIYGSSPYVLVHQAVEQLDRGIEADLNTRLLKFTGEMLGGGK